FACVLIVRTMLRALTCKRDFGHELLLTVDKSFLQSADRELLLAEGAAGIDRCVSGRQSCDAGDAMRHAGRSNLALIRAGACPARRVNDQVHLTILHVIY